MKTYGVRVERSDPLELNDAAAVSVERFPDWAAGQRAQGRPLAVDLFSGAGGLSLGLENAGWIVAAAVDHDRRALDTHRHHFGGLALDVDMADPTARKALVRLLEPVGVDLVAGGPPCQPFSRAGRSKIRSLVDDGVREARDARTDLWRAFVEVAVALNPRAILMENVPDMALGDDFQAVRTIVAKLEKAGYAVDVRLVDAWRYGVPQHRKRLLVLARHDGGSFSWPPEEGRITTLADAIGDLPELGDSTGGRLLTYHEPGKAGAFVQRMRRGAVEGVVHDHMTRPVRADDREVFMQMTTKTKYSDIPEHLRRYTTNTFNDKYKRLAWTDLSRSITAHIAKDGYWYIHPGEARTLTVREAARIQTFPDTFRFAGTRSDAFRQIGNAVPPLLAEAAARALLPHGESQPTAVSPQWSTAQSRLTKWARAEQRSRNWHALPGPAMTTAVAAAAALLSGVRGDTDHVADALAHLKGRAKFNTAQLREAAKMLRTASARRRMGRLEILCRRPTIWSDPQRIKAIVGMSAAEAALFDVLNGGDAMLLSTGAFRVAAAVSGSKSLERNRLTDGRVDVARLIGHGKQAPLRMAALRLIGETICTTTPRCGACPLRSVCAASATCLPDLPPPEPARLPR